MQGEDGSAVSIAILGNAYATPIGQLQNLTVAQNLIPQRRLDFGRLAAYHLDHAAATLGDATPMLLVRTRIGQSPIEGTGLFAAEPIKAGTVTWRFMPGYDQLFTAEQIANLPDDARAAVETYTYLHAPSGLFVYCLDNARFMNHADDANTAGVHSEGEIDGYDVATRDIAVGEELTCDYRVFDAGFAQKIGTAG